MPNVGIRILALHLLNTVQRTLYIFLTGKGKSRHYCTIIHYYFIFLSNDRTILEKVILSQNIVLYLNQLIYIDCYGLINL